MARAARVARAARAARGTAATSPLRAAISTRAGDARAARAASTTFAGLVGRARTASGPASSGGGTAPNAAVMAGASVAVIAATGANRIGLAGSMPTGVGGWVCFLCVSETRGGWLVLPSSWLSRGLAFGFCFRRRRGEGGEKGRAGIGCPAGRGASTRAVPLPVRAQSPARAFGPFG